MKTRFFLNSKLLITICLFTSFTLADAQNISEKTEVKLNKLQTIMERATLDGKLLSIVKYYADDVIIMPGFNPAIKGKDALSEAYKRDIDQKLKYHSFSGNVEKRWQNGNEIFERGTFGMAVSSKNSVKPKAYYGSYFQIWNVESDDNIKISFVIWNLDFNPCE
ncbi:MAG: hypothetical protein JEY94_06940 [Melioribacteraceae bacterium]|nr:hypothetical protein [Melioribacteraceae bacterium]